MDSGLNVRKEEILARSIAQILMGILFDDGGGNNGRAHREIYWTWHLGFISKTSFDGYSGAVMPSCPFVHLLLPICGRKVCRPHSLNVSIGCYFWIVC